MKRLFEKYTEWEDFKSGMYTMYKEKEEYLIRKSVSLLTNDELFLTTCKAVVNEWKITTSVHLTNGTINRKAWLGQAACCYLYKVPELLTRVAWGKLTADQQNAANNIADTVINSYLNNLNHANNRRLHI